MRLCFAVFMVAVATPGAAQSTYVGASLVGEFARFGDVNVNDDDLRIASELGPWQNGETIGFDVRVGRALGERWGVELEFARGGTIEQRRTVGLSRSLGDLPVIVPPGIPIPSFEFDLRSEQQHTTIGAVAWVRQDLGDRIDLAFLGGVSFSRVEAEQEIRFADSRLAVFLPYPREIETVQHGVGPVVGTEAVITLGEQAALTTGVRIHGVGSGGLEGWLVRPSVGLRWSF